jgi:urease accessory protein
VAYAAGFLATTATLHFGGVLAGLSLRKYLTGKAIRVTQFLGLLCGGAGVYLFSRL